MVVAALTGQQLPSSARARDCRPTWTRQRARSLQGQRRKLKTNSTENCEPEYGIPQSISPSLSGVKRPGKGWLRTQVKPAARSLSMTRLKPILLTQLRAPTP